MTHEYAQGSLRAWGKVCGKCEKGNMLCGISQIYQSVHVRKVRIFKARLACIVNMKGVVRKGAGSAVSTCLFVVITCSTVTVSLLIVALVGWCGWGSGQGGWHCGC